MRISETTPCGTGTAEVQIKFSKQQGDPVDGGANRKSPEEYGVRKEEREEGSSRVGQRALKSCLGWGRAEDTPSSPPQKPL